MLFAAKDNRGVALLEVLISVSILAFGMGTALKALNVCTRTQSRLEERHTAQRLAEEQMSLLLAMGQGTVAGEQSGRFEAPFAEYSWAEKVQNSADEKIPFRHIELRVWRGSEQERRLVYTLRTLAL